ncbi:MAG TPA: hypothetical protein DCQ64_24105 [Candidatus Rokubacteria bacterium]|nr:hypothetical protein [Candidatus Rokubacteria bacterium]
MIHVSVRPVAGSADGPRLVAGKPGARERILVRRWASLGDVLMALPALRAVRRSRPGAWVHLQCAPPFARLLQGSADADLVSSEPDPGGYTRIIDLDGAYERQARAGRWQHPAEAFASAAGVSLPRMRYPVPPAADLAAWAAERLPVGPLYVACGLRSMCRPKAQWHEAGWVAQARALPDVTFVAMDPQPRPPLGADGKPARMFYRLPNVVDLTGQTQDLRQAFAILGRCRACVSVDTGLYHLGNAAGLPVLGLFAGVPSGAREPLAGPCLSIDGEAECSPCLDWSRCARGGNCLGGVTGKRAAAGLSELLYWTRGADISVVVLCYNRCEMTADCLRSLRADVPDAEIVLVDNGSWEPMGAAHELATRVVVLRDNVGVTRGFNAGLREASADVICMLGNDTIIHPGGMQALAEAARRTGISSYLGGILDANLLFAGYTTDPAESTYPDGTSLTARRDVWERVGWLDEVWSPGFCEDSDWGLRARSMGYDWEIVPDVLTHLGSQTVRGDAGLAESAKRNVRLLRERWQGWVPIRHRDDAAYREHYQNHCQGDTRPQMDPGNYEHPRIAWLMERAAGRVLDVGCCTGDLVGALAAAGLDVTGADPGEVHIRIARERYPGVRFVQGFAEDLGGEWDTVLAGDVIEHVLYHVTFLRCLVGLGARVLLTTPNGEWPSPEHQRVYTPESAAALVAPYGGTVELIPDRDGRPRWLGIDVRRPCESS